jgi:hypothetical protein
MAKNPHAVALGRLGGSKGGVARAKALGARRRREIASAAGAARANALSAAKRKQIASRAAQARWARVPTPVTAQDAPESVRRLLKTYDPRELRWAVARDRYAVVREVLVRGDEDAKRWLGRVLRRDQLRALAREYAGTGCSEPERALLRRELGLTTRDIPKRPYLNALWNGS